MEGVKEFWPQRRVLVTGATGLLGSWLVKELLARGAYVAALILDADPQSELFRSGDAGRVAVVNGRLEDFWTLERAVNAHETDTVFHLGAQTIVGTARRFPLATFEANIRGTYNLLEACRLHLGIVRRVVVASSDKAYGEQERLPYTEDMPMEGRYPYDASKSCADILSRSYHHTCGLPVAVARCGNLFGGGDLNWSRIVPGTIRSLLRGERPVIRSDGSFVRDYVYVKDAVAAFLLLAERLGEPAVRGQGFNFGPDKPRTVREVVAALQAATGRTDLEPQVLDQAQGEIRSQHLSAAKARSLLGWQPAHDFEPALRETVEWYGRFLGAAVR